MSSSSLRPPVDGSGREIVLWKASHNEGSGCESTRREDRTEEMFCIIYGLQVENAAPMLMRERGWVPI